MAQSEVEPFIEDAPPEPPEELDTDEPVIETEGVEYDPEAGNLIPELRKSDEGKNLLEEIRDRVQTDFDRDWESTGPYRERLSNDINIFMGILQEKPFPFENCANPHVPIMLENISRLQSRVLAEIFGDWVYVVGVQPVGEDDQDIADLITMHTNWQFREQIKDFRRQADRGLMVFLVGGDIIWHSYRDHVRDINRHVVLTPEEFVSPYSYVSTMPDLSDLPHYTHVLRLYPHELEAMSGQWVDIDKVLDEEADSHSQEPDQPIREQVGEAMGQEEPADDETAPYKILQYYGWLKLPNEDRHRWCKVVLHEASQTLLHLSIYEKPDWRDQERYNRQVTERDLYVEALQVWTQTAQQQRVAEAGAEQSIRQGEQREADLDNLQLLQASEPPPEPQPPVWMSGDDPFEEPEPVKMVPIHMYAHGVCLENLVGNIGMGMGQIEADFNRAANTALAQFTDSATLANCWSIITTQNVSFPNPFSVKPGAVNKAHGVTDIKGNIMELKPSPANSQLVELVDKFYGYGQSAIQAPNVLSGEPGKSGETYRGIATRIEQATKQLSTLAMRFAIPLKQVYENNAELNSMFMDDIEVVRVTNHLNRKQQTIRVGRRMYVRDYRVEFKSDMQFTSEAQRISEADQMVQMPQTVPALQHNFAFQYETVKQALESRGKHELVQLLGARPDPPQVFGPPPPPPGPPGAQPTGPGGGGPPSPAAPPKAPPG